jgi:hypothetical protein
LQLNKLFPECLLLLAKFFQIGIILIKNNDSNESEIADMLMPLIEGGINFSRALANPEILVSRLMQFRKRIQLHWPATARNILHINYQAQDPSNV